jgi:glycerol-3-phosphate acyltransferase PlsY
LACIGTWLLVAYFSRYSSLSALLSALAVPLYYLLGDRALWYVDKYVLMMLVVTSALLIYRHRENIGKLLQGQESKIGSGRKP